MLLVYAPKITPRFRYIAEYLLGDLCGFELVFTSSSGEFASYEGARISYFDTSVTGEPHIVPHTLLYEKGLKPQNIALGKWNEVPVIFKNDNPLVPFDIFAASFFLLSRYEEYLPHIADSYNRFEADSSIAFQNNFLHLPVINLWAAGLRNVILSRFPQTKHRESSYEYISTIDIDNAWAFRHKGFMRTSGAYLRSLLRLDLTDFKERALTLAGRMQDPYDTYDLLQSVQEEYRLKMIYFILLGNYGVNDKNISANNFSFQALIKRLADYGETGIHPSFGSNENPNQVRIEISRLAQITHKPVTKSRQHFLKLHFPATYKNLLSCGVQEDYTMGYATRIGFRAGVCSPFTWYDLDSEQETSLVVYPFAIMDATLLYYMKLSPEEAVKSCAELIEAIRKVNGTCITVWHNETISNWRQWAGWREVYREVVKMASAGVRV
jgi:hypothetical protein